MENSDVNRYTILIGLFLAITIIYGSYEISNSYYFDEKEQQALQAQTELTQLRANNRELERMKVNIEQLDEDLNKTDGEFRALKSLVPSDSELPKILDWIGDRAAERNLKLDKFSQPPAAVLVNPGALIELPVEVQVSGDFSGIGRLVEDLARFERVLNVQSVHMTQERQQNPVTTHAVITFAAYRGNDRGINKAKF